jgi:hypothetical protein
MFALPASAVPDRFRSRDKDWSIVRWNFALQTAAGFVYIAGRQKGNGMSEFSSMLKTMVDFVFDRHHYIMVAVFIMFLIILIIILGANSGASPFPLSL